MNGIFFGGLFWGILILLIGLSIVLKYAFHIEIPLVRVFLGIIVILIGLRLIIGNTRKSGIIPRTHTRNVNITGNCDVVFSSATIDLSNLKEGQQLPAEISVVFGNAVVVIPDTINLEVMSTTVFGTTILPDRTYAGFGEDRYFIKNDPMGKSHRIQVTTVFGKLVFETTPTHSSTNDKASGDTSPTDNSF